MIIKFMPFLFALFFLLGLEVFFLFNSLAIYIVAILLLSSIYAGKSLGKKWIFAITPAIFSIFSSALFYLVTFPGQKQIFIFLASFMYYLTLLGAYRLKNSPEDKTARGMVISGSFTALFFSLTSFYGFYLNFLIPIFALMLVYFIISFLIGFQTLSLFEQNKKLVFLYVFSISFILAQISWALNFWPFGYLTTGVIALILYYVLWEMVKSHFLLLLSKKRIVWQIATFSFLAGIVLITSKWIPAF